MIDANEKIKISSKGVQKKANAALLTYANFKKLFECQEILKCANTGFLHKNKSAVTLLYRQLRSLSFTYTKRGIEWVVSETHIVYFFFQYWWLILTEQSQSKSFRTKTRFACFAKPRFPALAIRLRGMYHQLKSVMMVMMSCCLVLAQPQQRQRWWRQQSPIDTNHWLTQAGSRQ